MVTTACSARRGLATSALASALASALDRADPGLWLPTGDTVRGDAAGARSERGSEGSNRGSALLVDTIAMALLVVTIEKAALAGTTRDFQAWTCGTCGTCVWHVRVGRACGTCVWE